MVTEYEKPGRNTDRIITCTGHPRKKSNIEEQILKEQILKEQNNFSDFHTNHKNVYNH